MPVELRARRSRPSYTTALKLSDNEDEEANDVSSQSSFDLGNEQNGSENGADGLEDALEDNLSDDDVPDAISIPRASKWKGKEKAKSHQSAAASPRQAVMLAPSPSKPNTRLSQAPPPNARNRHRAIPLHNPPLRTIRLLNEPKLFSHVETVNTRSISDPRVGERVSKSYMYNVGEGPIWELMEDRSWFKECAIGTQTRPIQYKSLRLKEGLQFLTPREAIPYLPHNKDGLDTLVTISCYFGPYSTQKKVELSIFESLKIADFFPESKSHVFYAGAPVWAMDWCPVSVDDHPHRNYKQYIAVAPFPSNTHSPEIGSRVSRPSPACIQIWSLAPTSPPKKWPQKPMNQQPDDNGTMTCEMVLCIDSGPSHDLKWCPLPTHDEHCDTSSESTSRKLGILAGTFEDGSLSVYVVPDPQSLPVRDVSASGPIYVKIQPHARVNLNDTVCWCLDWANSDLIAVGCTNGSVATFHVKDVLNATTGTNTEVLRPSHYLQLHQSAVRAVSWVRVPQTAGSGDVRLDQDPTVFVSGGYDGIQLVTDTRDRRGNCLNKTRDITLSVAYSHHAGGPVVNDHENTIKSFSLVPSMLGKGRTILEPSGPVWSISASDFHPQIAVGSADGVCQTTTLLKAKRTTGSLAPFFIHKIFQLDYSRISGEFRMLENFLPYEYQELDKVAGHKQKKNMSPRAPEHVTSGAWSPEISVTRVVWQSGSGLARAPLLASATASGLCRVDWLLGRFAYGHFPYTGIEYVRGEVEGQDVEEVEKE